MKVGGVEIVFRNDMHVAQPEANSISTVKYSIWRYIKKNKLVHIVGIYCPPPIAENVTTNATFLDDLTEPPMDKLVQLENIILLGYFNMHIEEITSPDTIIFSNTMKALGQTNM